MLAPPPRHVWRKKSIQFNRLTTSVSTPSESLSFHLEARSSEQNNRERDGDACPFKDSQSPKEARCRTGAATKPSRALGSTQGLIICHSLRRTEVGLLLFCECVCVCWGVFNPTCWSSASCYLNEDRLTLHLALCSAAALGLESFLLAALGAAARSQTSLLGCCGPSAQESPNLSTVAMQREQPYCW